MLENIKMKYRKISEREVSLGAAVMKSMTSHVTHLVDLYKRICIAKPTILSRS
jgi:hypothetical protein